MVLVDSSAWIEAIRRTGSIEVKVAVEGLLEAYEATLCPPVCLEVLGGARRRERAALQVYFDVLPYVAFSPDTWTNTIALSWRLRDHGFSLPWNDLLIATVAMQQDCRVYAVDKHFDTIVEKTGLRLYRPGYGGTFEPDEAREV